MPIDEHTILIVVVGAGILLFVLSVLSLRRRERWAIDRFNSRTPTEDAEFLSELEITPGTEEARLALGARRTFAKVGKIDVESLRATDRFYPDMAELPLYDSLDILTIILEMERELRVKLSSEDISAAFEPLGRKSSPTVGEVIKKLISLVADKERLSN